MPLELHPLTEADARRSVDIEEAAHAPDPFNKILSPGPFLPDELERRASQLVAELKEDPTVRWFKVVDTDLPEPERMIACAKITICLEKPLLAPCNFGPECNVEACELMLGDLRQRRERIMGDKPHVCKYLSGPDERNIHDDMLLMG